MESQEFKNRVEELVVRINAMLERAVGENKLVQKKVEAIYGRRYVKLVASYINLSTTSKYAYAFVDSTNGNLLKPAGWNAPAKGARGNVYNPDYGLSGCREHGTITFR